MNARARHLKIKVKSLAEEARIIRHEEHQTAGMERWNLQHHRKGHLRWYTRCNQLAYGCLKGIPYSQLEQKCSEPPSWGEIKKLIVRFGGTKEQFEEWRKS